MYTRISVAKEIEEIMLLDHDCFLADARDPLFTQNLNNCLARSLDSWKTR